MQSDSQELLARYQTGDESAANAIFDRYASRLLALARSRLSPRLARRLDADDVVQSTYRSFFVRARQGQFAAERPGDLWRLLATITLHKLARRIKREQAAKRSPRREIQDDAQPQQVIEQLADREPTPADVVTAAEELHWLMLQFDVTARVVIELRMQGYTLEEVAQAVNRSERTVRRWLAEARELLAQRCDEQQVPDRDSASVPSSLLASAALNNLAAELRHEDFHLERLIGAGGTSKVYAATNRSNHQRVAVKVLRKRLRSQPHLVERFVREAQLVARLKHPGIVPIHGLGRLRDGNFFMVLDLIDGFDLARLLESNSISWQRAARIVTEVSRTIHFAHERGVIHRDLKPGNVLIDALDRVFVTDFGFAWQTADGDHEANAIVGTAGFMAPEQIEPDLGPVGPHTDVFGLGALLFMLCAGRPAMTASECLCNDEDDSVAAPPMSSSVESLRLPNELRLICDRCMERDWRRRPPNASAVAEMLSAILGGGGRC